MDARKSAGYFNRLFGAFVCAIPTAIIALAERPCSALVKPLGSGVVRTLNDMTFPGTVNAALWVIEPQGPVLYVGGQFDFSGDLPLGNLARWDGQAWHDVGGGVDGRVHALGWWDDGRGPALYVGGVFDSVGNGIVAANIARWDGKGWEPLGAGVTTVGFSGSPFPAAAFAIFPFQDRLVVGGRFDRAGGVPVTSLAVWDSKNWSDPEPHFEVPAEAIDQQPSVFDLEEFNGRLLAAGAFSRVAGLPTNYVAGWDGFAWSPLFDPAWDLQQSDDFLERAYSLVIADFGDGPQPVVGGFFDRMVVRWDGASWIKVGNFVAQASNFRHVRSLAIVEGDLYAAGRRLPFAFETGEYVARLERNTWQSILGPRLFPDLAKQPEIIVPHVDGHRLIIAGTFGYLDSPTPLNSIAVWYCQEGDLDASGCVDDTDLSTLLGAFGCAPPTDCPQDITGDSMVDDRDLGVLLDDFGKGC